MEPECSLLLFQESATFPYLQGRFVPNSNMVVERQFLIMVVQQLELQHRTYK